MPKPTAVPKEAKAPKAVKPKKWNWSYEITEDVHELLTTARGDHEDLVEAVITPAWMLDMKADAGVRDKIMKVLKVPEVFTLQTEWDWVIGINKNWWEDASTTAEMKLYELDQRLCEIGPATDVNGDQREYEGGEVKCWSRRKPEIVAFQGPVKRHGLQSPEISSLYDICNGIQEALPFVPKAVGG